MFDKKWAACEIFDGEYIPKEWFRTEKAAERWILERRGRWNMVSRQRDEIERRAVRRQMWRDERKRLGLPEKVYH